MSTENFDKCSVVLLDVAGTITPINFVKETLIPFAVQNIEEYLKGKWEVDDTKEVVKSLNSAEELTLEKTVELFKKSCDENSEEAAIKTLQGLVYKKGYESGDLKAPIFPDVKDGLMSWSKSRKVGIYSTGSIESQKLFFAHTSEGDLSEYISNYFDQNVGSKTASESYEKIAKEFDIKPEEIVFVTDNIDEAKSAKTAGCVSVLITREGNEKIAEGDSKDFKLISTFSELPLSAKRKNPDEMSTESTPPAKVAKTDGEVAAENGTCEEKMEVDNSETKKSDDTVTAEPSKETKKTEKATTVETAKEVTEEMETDAEDKPGEKVEVAEEAKEKVEEKKADVEMEAKEHAETNTSKIEAENKTVETPSTEKGEEKPAPEKSSGAVVEETLKVEAAKENSTSEKLAEKSQEEKSMEVLAEKKPADSVAEVKSSETVVAEKNAEASAEKPSEVAEIKKDAEMTVLEENKQKSAEVAKIEETVSECKSDETDSKAEKDKIEPEEKVDKEIKEETSKIESEEKEEKKETGETSKVQSEEKDETANVDSEEKKVEDVEKASEEVSTETPSVENGKETDKTEVNGIEEEKENKSEIANGAEKNGDCTKNGDVETEEKDDIKVKKIEETETTPVSVEA